MLIVLEGTDGTGKTYLAERLVDAIEARSTPSLDDGVRYLESVEIIKRGIPVHDDPYVEYDLSWYSPGRGKHYILDRWHLGDWVYGRLYRGESKLGMRGLHSINRRLISQGALRIVVDEDEDVVAARLLAKNEDYLQPEHQGRVLDEYRMLAQQFNWLTLTSEVNLDSVIDWARSLEEQAVHGW